MHVVPHISAAHELIEQFFHQLSLNPHRALMLDYDGTLAPFRRRPEDAFPYEGVSEILDAILTAAHTRVVLITGRAIRDLLPLINFSTLPEIWGSHGCERRYPDGQFVQLPLDAPELAALDQAWHWACTAGIAEYAERKASAVALNFRGMSDGELDGLRERCERIWADLAADTDLQVKGYDGGIELRAVQHHKGIAVEGILATMHEHPAAAFLGDDLTDEDAFRELNAKGGLTILVRSALRPSEAQLWMQPPDELLCFLRRWHEVASAGVNSASAQAQWHKSGIRGEARE